MRQANHPVPEAPGRGGARRRRPRGACAAPALAVLVAGAVLMSGATATASAAKYVAEPAGGGRIVLKVNSGRLRSVKAKLPAGCQNVQGGTWDAPLAVRLRGDLGLRRGVFRIQGEAPNGVRYRIKGRLRDGAITGRARLTFFFNDAIGQGDPDLSDDSYLCDTGAGRYRATRQR
jgi:hypothetical protein